MSAVKTNINKMAAQQSPDMCDFKGCGKTFRKEIRLIKHKQKTETGKTSGERGERSRLSSAKKSRSVWINGSVGAISSNPSMNTWQLTVDLLFSEVVNSLRVRLEREGNKKKLREQKQSQETCASELHLLTLDE